MPQVGQVFDRWTVIDRRNPEGFVSSECGTERAVNGPSLFSGSSKSCSCLSRERAVACGRSRVKNPISRGDRFSRWTVEDATDREAVLCRCECGTVRTVRAYNLVGGLSTSCGCRKIETSAANGRANATHGLSRHSLYKTWQQMMFRCAHPNCKDWPYYGGRGIRVHKPWYDVSVFVADVLAELGPKPYGYTFDRIDNDGHYEPGNIRWATRAQQNLNKRAPSAVRIAT
jgi:hypothetical protein